jgi:DNA modification methylase
MTDWQGKNLLCFGDNLQFLTDTDMFPKECVDLIYLDPPFNSQQSYNVLFREASGSAEAAQIKAFEDTWIWDAAARDALTRIHLKDSKVPAPLVDLISTFTHFLKASPMMAYLVQMAIRLVHMHRILKPTGSLYLHCDPTASHYLKLVLDGIFGPKSFLNEIVWKRSSAHSDTKQGMRRCGRIHDVILLYAKTENYAWNSQYSAYSDDYAESEYRHVFANGRGYKETDVTAARPGGDTEYEWRVKRRIGKNARWEADLEEEYLRPKSKTEYKGVTPYTGRYWAYSKENMAKFAREGLLIHRQTGMPRLVQFLDNMPGVPIQDLWTDIPPAIGRENLGYPTQKPTDLLKRIVSTSSNPGDVVLDPFCGCGTTIDAVETLNRENPDAPARTWIGIDVTHLSINLIKHRLTRFTPPPVYEVIGEPGSVSGAAALARQDPYQFQFWVLGLIGARPWGGTRKKGADKGIDGVRFFVDERKNGQDVTKRMLVQVKSGKVGSKDIRDFVGTLSREEAEMGVFITLAEPTAPMKQEAASAGTYISPWGKKHFPRVQILTIEELMADQYRPKPKCLLVPGGSDDQHTLAEPPKYKTNGPDQGKLFVPDRDGHRPPSDAEEGDDET